MEDVRRKQVLFPFHRFFEELDIIICSFSIFFKIVTRTRNEKRSKEMVAYSFWT